RADARKRDGNDLLEALVNRHQPPLGAHLVKGRVARFFMHKRCALSFNETLMERGVREDDSIAPESSGQLRSHPAHNVLRAHGARLTCNLMSPSEQNQGWNAANTELGGQVRLGLGIYLGQPHLGFKQGGCLLELRRHHLARSTPRRPKVNQQRQVTALQMTGEGRCGQINGFSGEQRVLAPPAIGLLCQLVGWHAVDGLAVWADDMNAVTHEGAPWDTEEVMAPAVGPL